MALKVRSEGSSAVDILVGMTDDEMDFCEYFHQAITGPVPHSDDAFAVGFNPLREIDELFSEIDSRDADWMDWFAIYCLCQRARRMVASGDPAKIRHWFNKDVALREMRTSSKNQWHQTLDAMSMCGNATSLLAHVIDIETHARKILYDGGLLLTPTGSHRTPKPPSPN